MINEIPSPSGIRLPATLFLASPIASVAVVVSAAIGFSNVGDFETITPQQMESIRAAWIAINTFTGSAVLLGAAGLVTLSYLLKATKARLWAWLALVSGIVAMAACLFFIILRVGLIGSRETSLGLNSNYQLSAWAFIGVAAPLSTAATALAGISLFTSGWLRRTGLVVGILSALLLAVNVILGFPLPAMPFLWLALGVGLRLRKESRTRVVSSDGQTPGARPRLAISIEELMK